ncbi:MAG: hypothetical protein ACW964_01540 [Candidatus Hodarchaeales archaeon]|jgi:lysophospholipase L1-like esterase
MESYIAIIEEIAIEFDLPTSDVYSYTENKNDWFIDGVHPNEIGALKIAEKLNESFLIYIQ